MFCQNLIGQVQVIQNRAMRLLLNCNRYVTLREMLTVLYMLSAKQKIMFDVALFIFKIRKGLMPEYICDRVRCFK